MLTKQRSQVYIQLNIIRYISILLDIIKFMPNYNNYNRNANYPNRNRAQFNASQRPKHKSHIFRNLSMLIIILALASGLLYASKNRQHVLKFTPTTKNTVAAVATPKPKTSTNTEAELASLDVCNGNTLAQNVIVVISKQHLWACKYNKVVYNSPVTTGYDKYASDITPVGVYHIYNKYTNVQLTGSDKLGSWNVHVDYWMPFLFNQYGAYGLHDADWVKPSQFGHISPNSKLASHGCVELPTPTAKWIYNWIDVGSTVTIQQTA